MATITPVEKGSARPMLSAPVLSAGAAIVAIVLAGCVKVASEDERFAALAAEPLSPDYQVAMLSTWASPPYVEVVDLIDEQQLDGFGASIAEGFSRELPARVTAWPAAYGRRSVIGQDVLSAGRINEFARSQMPAVGASGFDAIMTVNLKPVVNLRRSDIPLGGGTKTVRTMRSVGSPSQTTPFSVEIRQADGSFELIHGQFQLTAMRAYVNIRSVPGDVLLYFDSNVEVMCDNAERFLSADSDSKAAVSDCTALLAGRLLSNLERNLRRMRAQ